MFRSFRLATIDISPPLHFPSHVLFFSKADYLEQSAYVALPTSPEMRLLHRHFLT